MAEGIRWCRGLWNAVQILGAGVPQPGPLPAQDEPPGAPTPTKGLPTVYGLKNNAGKASVFTLEKPAVGEASVSGMRWRREVLRCRSALGRFVVLFLN